MDFSALCISLQSIAMTNKEILQADLLDILFEHRNKTYGAYALRKNYNQRLQWALAISLSAVLFSLLALEGKTGFTYTRPEGTSVTLQTYPDPAKPKQPEQSRPRVEPRRAQRQYVTQVRIVSNNEKTNMPQQNELETAQISVHNVDGLPTDESTSEKAAGEGQEKIETANIPVQQPQIFSSTTAEFPGGVEAFRKFLLKYLVTPDELEIGDKKTVLVRFKVDSDGSLSDPQIIQSAGDKYDKEVLRVLSKMPKWIPATQNGAKVATWFTQPVTFIGVE